MDQFCIIVDALHPSKQFSSHFRNLPLLDQNLLNDTAQCLQQGLNQQPFHLKSSTQLRLVPSVPQLRVVSSQHFIQDMLFFINQFRDLYHMHGYIILGHHMILVLIASSSNKGSGEIKKAETKLSVSTIRRI